MRALLTTLTLFMAGTVALAQPATVSVEKAWVRRAVVMPDSKPGAPSTAAGYALLQNRGKSADALIGASTDVAERVEVHETRSMSGMMMMEKVDRVAVPAGGSLTLKPGAYHLMLIGLKKPLAPGQTVDLTLEFERAGKITTRAEVR